MLIFGQNMTSTVDFGWKPTTTAIFVGIRHVGVNAPHHFSQKPPLKGRLLPDCPQMTQVPDIIVAHQRNPGLRQDETPCKSATQLT